MSAFRSDSIEFAQLHKIRTLVHRKDLSWPGTRHSAHVWHGWPSFQTPRQRRISRAGQGFLLSRPPTAAAIERQLGLDVSTEGDAMSV